MVIVSGRDFVRVVMGLEGAVRYGAVLGGGRSGKLLGQISLLGRKF